MGATTALTGEVSTWSIDTRTLQAGDVFFALKGDVHDGHRFAGDALQRGAGAVIVQEEVNSDVRVIRVDDTLGALQKLGSWARKRWGGVVAAVTGSAGKTSTKDVVAALLGSGMPTGRTM